MYNLIVTGHKGAWDGDTYRLEANRFGEYTEGELAARYRTLNDSATAELVSLPTLFAYEQGHNADARVGVLQGITLRSGKIRFAYHLLPGTVTVAGKPSLDVPPGTLNSILKQAGLKRRVGARMPLICRVVWLSGRLARKCYASSVRQSSFTSTA